MTENQSGKVRVWEIQFKQGQGGMGCSPDSYCLKYDGWELENPPSQVVDKRDYDKLIDESITENPYEYSQYCQGLNYRLDKALEALKYYADKDNCGQPFGGQVARALLKELGEVE